MSRLLRFFLLGLLGVATFNLQMRLVPHRPTTRPVVVGLCLTVAGLACIAGNMGLLAVFVVAAGSVATAERSDSRVCLATAVSYVCCLVAILMLLSQAAGPAGRLVGGMFGVVAVPLYVRRIREHQIKLASIAA